MDPVCSLLHNSPENPAIREPNLHHQKSHCHSDHNTLRAVSWDNSKGEELLGLLSHPIQSAHAAQGHYRNARPLSARPYHWDESYRGCVHARYSRYKDRPYKLENFLLSPLCPRLDGNPPTLV